MKRRIRTISKALEDEILMDEYAEDDTYAYILYDMIAYQEIRRTPLANKETDPREWEFVALVDGDGVTFPEVEVGIGKHRKES